MKAVAVLASGQGTNLQSLLDRASQPDYPARVRLVVSDCGNAAALERGRRAGVETLCLDPALYGNRDAYDESLVDMWQRRGIDLVCLAGFMRMLGPRAVLPFQHRILNIHPSLLPAFPGLNAQAQAVACGVKVSGATVHFVDLGMDTGPIVWQEAVSVYPEDDEISLGRRILEVEHSIYPRAVELWARNRLVIQGRRVYIK